MSLGYEAPVSHQEPRDEAYLYRTLATTSLANPEGFADDALAILIDYLALEACSLYLSTGGSSPLGLVAQRGFDYSKYHSFSLPEETLAGHVARTDGPAPLVVEGLSGNILFRDQELLRIGVDMFVGVKITVHEPQALLVPETIGVLCVYPRPGADVGRLTAILARLAPYFGVLYLAALERRLMKLRRLTVGRAAFRKDIGGLIYSFLQILKAKLNVDAGSVFLWDRSADVLYLRSTTGLDGSVQRHEVRLPVAGSTAQAVCFRSRQPVVYSAVSASGQPPDIFEQLAGPLQNAVLYPLLTPSGRPTSSQVCLGVVALLNHATEFEGRRLYTDLSWADSFILDFAAEMLAVLLYQLLRVRDHEDDFEKLMHGAQANIQGALHSLLLADARYGLRESLDDSAYYAISNAMALLTDLKGQMDRNELVNARRVDRAKFELYGRVLVKLPAIARMIAEVRGLRGLSVDMEQIHRSYRSFPPVFANEAALLCVFRNLIDNSIKYADPRSQMHHLRIEAEPLEEGVAVRVKDDGIGIPNEDLPRIFRDGFRGTRALSATPQGLGRGLFDCARIMKKLNGDLRYVPSSDGMTVFEVVVPR